MLLENQAMTANHGSSDPVYINKNRNEFTLIN